MSAEALTRGSGQTFLTTVVAADAAYAMPLATTLRSLAENNRRAWPLDIHVLCDGIDAKTKQSVSGSLPNGSASISWHPVDFSSFTNYSPAPHISKMTYARLLLPQLLPTTDKVLYLDSDILVLKDLGPLWNADVGNAVLAAVLDPLDDHIKCNKPGLEKAPRVTRYFNAGVLLIDLVRWRSERISERAIEYLDNFPLSPFSDQDALNVACDGRWKELGPEWNFQQGPTQNIEPVVPGLQPSIVHFVTSHKPWKPSSLSPYAACYDAFRARTCFSRTPAQRVRETFERAGHRILRRSALLRAIWGHARSFRTLLRFDVREGRSIGGS
jgi:lipopolysaccharide biosynthesis glycosyltransferase